VHRLVNKTLVTPHVSVSKNRFQGAIQRVAVGVGGRHQFNKWVV